MDADDQKQQTDEREDTEHNLMQINQDLQLYVIEESLMQQIDKQREEIMRDFSGDVDMEHFSNTFEKHYRTLKESHNTEVYFLKKSKETALELAGTTAQVDGVFKAIQSYEQLTEASQREMEERQQNIQDFNKQKEEKAQQIIDLQEEVQKMDDKLIKRMEEVEIQNQNTLRDLKQNQEDMNRAKEQIQSKSKSLKQELEYCMQDLMREQQMNQKNTKDLEGLKQQIEKIEEAKQKQEERKKNEDINMEQKKGQIESTQKEKEIKSQTIQNNNVIIEKQKEDITLKKKEKEKLHEQIKDQQFQHVQKENDINTKKEELKQIKANSQKQKKELEKAYGDIKDNEKQLDLLQRERAQMEKKLKHMREEQVDLEFRREEMEIRTKVIEEGQDGYLEGLKQIQENKEKVKEEMMILERIGEEKARVGLKNLKEQRDQIHDEIDHCMKERTQTNKQLKQAEDEEHNKEEVIIYQLNKLQKIENQVLGYETENDKLRKMINQLQKEQEKYGIEASQAHAKYYQTIEEVKIKNNQITELQKKNSQVEAKLKHQQNLYEAVRADRNLYSKNLLQSQEESEDLKKKFQRMNQQVEQFKDEIKQKDSELVKQDFEFNKVVDENKQTKLEKERVNQGIKSTDQVIKNQESHLARLKYIIQEAKSEKQRQDQDLEMVINERDILGTQLIKRNHEVQVLCEQIKLNQSNLGKGENFYQELNNQLSSLKQELVALTNELRQTEEQIQCIDQLKGEINNLEKDILSAQTKVKALNDELENPLNVHRWRKLEATDQENFQRILKIQTLQRRLIAKTEQVQEKENLIQQKEKLFMELKNILARQPGAEIYQQLATYKQSLQQKTAQMQKMMGELKNSQEQVDLLQFENNRIRGVISSMKREYFEKRKQQDRQLDNQANPQEYDMNGYMNVMPAHNGPLNNNGGGMILAGSPMKMN